MKDQIMEMLDERDAWLDKYAKKARDKSIYPTPKADEIQRDVLDMLWENFCDLECDFILEVLTRFGSAPSLIYDDNGHWAISSEGTQPVVCGKQRLTGHIGMSFMFKKSQWFSKIRPAIKHFLKEYKHEIQKYSK